MVFSLKYLGMTLVERPKGEELSAAAVKRIVATVSVPDCRTAPLPQLPLSPGRICMSPAHLESPVSSSWVFMEIAFIFGR